MTSGSIERAIIIAQQPGYPSLSEMSLEYSFYDSISELKSYYSIGSNGDLDHPDPNGVYSTYFDSGLFQPLSSPEEQPYVRFILETYLGRFIDGPSFTEISDASAADLSFGFPGNFRGQYT